MPRYIGSLLLTTTFSFLSTSFGTFLGGAGAGFGELFGRFLVGVGEMLRRCSGGFWEEEKPVEYD